MTPSSHTHGNITNAGALQTTDITIANGDKLVVTDSSNSGKVARTSVSFDGSTATKCLTQKGTWESFTNNSGTITKVGNTTSGDVTVSSSNNTASWGSAVTVGSVGGVDLKFTMPSNPNTDHYDWSDITNKPLTLTAAATGFTISGGTTSKTLTVGADYTLGAACAKAVDTSIAAASTSTNLPTSKAVATFVEGKNYLTSVPASNKTTLGGVKVWVESGSTDILRISTT